MSTSFLLYLGAALKAIGWTFLPLCALPLFVLLFPKNKILNRFTTELITLIDSFNASIGEMVKWLLPLLVVIVAFTVFALSIFGQSWTKLFESAEYLHAMIIMLGAAASLLAGQHVRVDVWHSHMGASARARVDLYGFYLLLLPVCLIILWNSQSFISTAWKIQEVSPETDGIAGVYLLKTLIPLFALTMIAQGLAIALRAVLCLCGYEQPKTPPNIDAFFTRKTSVQDKNSHHDSLSLTTQSVQD